jgi:hypothetical protein
MSLYLEGAEAIKNLLALEQCGDGFMMGNSWELEMVAVPWPAMKSRSA